jgi:hypothetical protein
MRLLSRILQMAAVVSLLGLPSANGQNNAPAGPNSDPIYQQLRNIAPGNEAVTVHEFDLNRDAATLHLNSGTVCFLPPVQGKVTGAVFLGDGTMSLEPPLSVERQSLKFLTKSDEFSEKFSELVLRFTDSTYEEIKKAGTVASGPCGASQLHDIQNTLRDNRMQKYNLDGRILEDVLSTEPGGLFWAFVHGQRYNSRELFIIDPHGAPDVEPEEVEFSTYDENKFGIWTAFHFSNEYKIGTATGSQKNGVIHIEHQQLDTTFERNANLSGKATTSFVSLVNGLRVVPFDLFHTLRVQNVTTEGGQPLSFIQEDKNHDADFFVILPKALAAGEKSTIVTTYGGKEAVSNEGGGNYFPIAREDWYPNNVRAGLGEYTAYDMKFSIPKGMKIAATGTLVSENNDGGQNVTVWKSEVPQTVAGFNFGRFKMEEAKLTDPVYLVQSYANDEPPDSIKAILQMANGDLPGARQVDLGANGTMSTVPLMKKALAEGELSVQLYTDYFGPIPFKRVAMTQQTACFFGQSWPALVWLPICSFFDTTVRNNLGIEFGDRGYWKAVAPHEVAHQWWGHQVGFGSYRDQWMSEGFANMSASLFIQSVEKNPKKFTEFWNDLLLNMTERNREGYRPIDVGPLTQGYRLDNEKTGFNVYDMLVYSKGAYILHMIRMMMWDNKTRDQNFKQTMQDFVRTYGGRVATTEDFKATVEKHMTPEMNLAGNGKMDWFFNEYVYGTALPTYNFSSTFDKDSNGDVVFSFKVTQSGVDDNFRMLVPMYFEFSDGRIVRLGRVSPKGNNSVEGKVPLKGMKDPPKRALINYYDDVLALSH